MRVMLLMNCIYGLDKVRTLLSNVPDCDRKELTVYYHYLELKINELKEMARRIDEEYEGSVGNM